MAVRLPALFLLMATLAAVPIPPLVGAAASGNPWTVRIDVQPDQTERLDLTIVHATGEFPGRYDRLCLPTEARPSRVRDDLGDITYQSQQEGTRYYLTFTYRTANVVVEMDRRAPAEKMPAVHGGLANPCAESDAVLEVRLTVPDGFVIAGASESGTLASDRRTLTFRDTGPVAIEYSHVAPLTNATGLVGFVEGPMRVVVPASMESNAREIARIAAPQLLKAAAQVGVRSPWEPIHAVFAPSTSFGAEFGRDIGNGVVAVQRDVLTRESSEGYPYVAAHTLLHELFHAESLPLGPGTFRDNITWFVEGSARFAERWLDESFPEGQRACATVDAVTKQCRFFDQRIRYRELAAAYRSGFQFDTSHRPWEAADAEKAGFYYGYSDYILAAYVQRFGADAYRAVWQELLGARADGSVCPCDAAWLAQAFVRQVGPNLTESELYHPYRDLFVQDEEAFRAAVGPLVGHDEAPGSGIRLVAPGAVGFALAMLVGAGLASRSPRRQ